MRRVDETSDALADLWRVLGVGESIDSALHRLLEVVLKVVTDAGAVSVTATQDRGPWTVAASDDWAVTIDKNQYAADDGPCLEAARTRQMVLVSGAEAFARWPEFAKDALAHGVNSYLAAPLVLSEQHVGSLNVYGFGSDSFDRLDEALLRLMTTAASAVIGNARQLARMREIAENLRIAMESRAEIEQAKGVLMAVRGITADEAFDTLVTQSQHTNTKLIVVARTLLESVRK